MITVLSLFLGLLSCGVTFALYKRRKWAPRLMIMVQVPFTVYDLATRQYGFILISVATILTAIIAHHERHEIDPRLAKAVHEKAHRIRAEDDLEHHEAVWVAAESLGVSRPEFSRISYLPGELSSAAMRAVSWSSYIPPVLSTWSRRFSPRGPGHGQGCCRHRDHGPGTSLLRMREQAPRRSFVPSRARPGEYRAARRQTGRP